MTGHTVMLSHIVDVQEAMHINSLFQLMQHKKIQSLWETSVW